MYGKAADAEGPHKERRKRAGGGEEDKAGGCETGDSYYRKGGVHTSKRGKPRGRTHETGVWEGVKEAGQENTHSQMGVNKREAETRQMGRRGGRDPGNERGGVRRREGES